jgi:hypothetical protein
MEMVEVKMIPSATDDSTYLQAKIPSVTMLSENAAAAIYAQICREIAERYVHEHYAQIAAKLDQNAIANLAIAEASKKIAEEIQRRPNIVKQIETQVFQRGIFGGMRRMR